MIKPLLRQLRLGGYAPRTLLDVGANLGQFTDAFLAEFPSCRPTLVEPNPHCCARLGQGPHEVICAAASNHAGTAELFLTTEWPESTGASLYRENTPFFRDDVAARQPVETVRLDEHLAGRHFDFIKIDVQGAELDVLDGSSEIIRQADYVLIEVSLVEYNLGAPPGEAVVRRLRSLGFQCKEIVEFHRLGGVMDGRVLQLDLLFERFVPRATQAHRFTALHDRADILAYLKERKASCADFSVLDVGAAATPWTADVVDATFDLNACSVARQHFSGNLNDAAAWAPLLDHVARFGKFSYSVCSHTLEDLAFPALALEMLPRVSEAGFIAVPSRELELMRHEGPYRGFIHHRWIFCLDTAGLLLVPKIPLVDVLPIEAEASWPDCQDRMELQLHWRKGLRYAVLNNDYLGPDATTVARMYAEVLNRPSGVAA